MPARRSRLAALASLALAACPPAPGDTTATAATADETAASTTSSTSSTGAATSTTTGPDTGSTSGAASTSTTTTTGGPPESICDPQPEPVRANFAIDDDADIDDLAYSHHCTVAALDQGLFLTIALAGCKADPDDPLEQPVQHTIAAEVFPQGPIDLAVGEAVVLSYVVRSPWWSNRAFTLRRPADELVLAGLKGDELPGGSSGIPAGFFAPLSLALLDTCPTEPPVDDTDCNFICEACYLIRRGSVRFAWTDGATVDVIDRSAQLWPDQPYWAVAGDVELREDIECTDTPDRWARLMLLRFKP